MGNLVLIAEVAALLFVAYAVGWAIGFAARRATRPAVKAETIPADRLAVAKGEGSAADALVKAPAIVEVSKAPAAMPAQPSTQPAAASAPVAEVSAIETLRTLSATMPLLPPEPVAVAPVPAPPAPSAAQEPPSASAEPAVLASEPPPAPAAEPAIEPQALPATSPGQAWSGKIHGHEAPLMARPEPASTPAPPAEPAVADVPAAVPTPAPPSVEPPPSQPMVVEEPVGLEAQLLATVEAHIGEASPPDPALENALLASVADGIAIETPAVAPPEPAAATSPPAVSQPAPVEFDEDAAMRDIEGGWSRRRTRAMAGAPELSDVGAAVAAAQVAVESVLARNGVSAERQAALGKPKGLSQPRPGGRDNLQQINGLSALDESTLNNLGVFHFDQIAAWTAPEVLWLENHAFARGRIGQESWQEQARALLGGDEARRASV